MKVVDLKHDYFLVHFLEEDDYLHALTVGPWTIYGQTLSEQQWVPTFSTTQGLVNRAVMWVQFPDLLIAWYHLEIITTLGNTIEKIVKIDEPTLQKQRGQYARLTIDLDLNSPLKTNVDLDEEVVQVMYEGLPQLCFTCGRVGHEVSTCPQHKHVNSASPTTDAGLMEPVSSVEMAVGGPAQTTSLSSTATVEGYNSHITAQHSGKQQEIASRDRIRHRADGDWGWNFD
ncbi:hypothetical protein K2173_003515 [Erythroxylum novogranatense]|uniref:CCHC-type domain-containing protein n=1 Tax=Erythroxylum novogranatense TaxID=1862640 RepID=A0AAV8TC04_9ROSI|nr:hypothetical protein K2173_003515 [Erythroxylum novogranatense]